MLLIHLSDIHFRKTEVESAFDPNKHLRNELLKDAVVMCRKLDKTPTAIVVTGDITFQGHPDEFTYAFNWFEEFANKCGTTTANFFVVPGNHDINRATANKPSVTALHKQIKATPNETLNPIISGLLSDPDSAALLYKSAQDYNHFAVKFFCDLSAPNRTIAKRDLILNDGSILRLNGANSTFVSSANDKKDDLFVDEASFQITKEPGIEHVYLCHHPFTWLRHGDRLSSHLNDVARLQLFGHDHSGRIDLKNDTVVLNAGAAHPDKIEHDWEPGYNLIELEVFKEAQIRKLKVTAHVRVWQKTPGQFVPKMFKSNDKNIYSLELDPWENPTSIHKTESDVIEVKGTEEIEIRRDPMDILRNVSIRFFNLSLSQKNAIAGKLGLFEDDDENKPDFERFRSVLIRARDKNLITELESEVSAIETVIKKI